MCGNPVHEVDYTTTKLHERGSLSRKF